MDSSLLGPYILTDELMTRIHRIMEVAGDLIFDRTVQVIPGAERVKQDGLRLTYSGQGSPFTSAVITDAREDVNFGLIEEFFKGRATAWELLVGPSTSAEALKKAAEAGYAVEAFEGLLGEYPANISPASDHEIEVVEGDRVEWAQVSEAGWIGAEELGTEIQPISQILSRIPGATYYWAKAGGVPAATASLITTPDGCLLAGASTRPQFRGLGLQQALIRRRLAQVPKGQLCLVGAVVGKTSYRNMQRHGFVPLFTEVLMRRLN